MLNLLGGPKSLSAGLVGRRRRPRALVDLRPGAGAQRGGVAAAVVPDVVAGTPVPGGARVGALAVADGNALARPQLEGAELVDVIGLIPQSPTSHRPSRAAGVLDHGVFAVDLV